MSTERTTRLVALEKSATPEETLAFFDECPAASLEDLIGEWEGVGIPTGHPLDGLLEAYGWRGKRFTGPDDVHPLVFDGPDGSTFSANPALIPMGLAARAGTLVRSRAVATAGRAFLRLARTRRPAARLRLMEYRGESTATMSYDALPINDHFRLVDEDTVIGAMDFRAIPEPFFFALRRDQRPADSA